MNIEQKLQSVDFSKNSNIKDSLLEKLLKKRRRNSLSLEDLNMVVAAGDSGIKKPEDLLKL